MEIQFAKRGLARCYEKEALAVRRWGMPVGRRFIQRIGLLYAASRLDELFSIRSLHMHPLKHDREGQWAITLDGRWRLIIEQRDDMILVQEVTNHYDD